MEQSQTRVCGAENEALMYDDAKLLVVLCSGDHQEVVRGAYRVVGAGVPLVGGCASDDLVLSMS
jgi:hypothetical protein